jgi:hypothetical protein
MYARTLLLALLAAGPVVAQSQTEQQDRIQSKADKARSKQDKAETDLEKAEMKADRREDRSPTEDEALALAALEGLMAQPSERSLPILKKVLAGPQSKLVKRRALFVLSQNHSPEARELLLQTARSPESDLRREAIRGIGISGDTKSLDALQDIYGTGGDDVKRDILQAWMIAGRRESIYQIALNAKTEKEANAAIRMLGVLGAKDELRKLADRPNAAGSLVDAYAISGDLEGLRKLADGSADREVRIEATRKIGIIHNDTARTALREIYARATDADIRDAALQGMLMSGDDQGVLEMYRIAKTADEKRRLLRTLSMMNSDAAIEAIDAALEKKP